MILPAGSAKARQGNPPWPARVEYLARSAGMDGLGFNLVTLMPGERSSDRHWHSHSHEALFVIEGQPTVIENDGPHQLGPGDAAIWPAGIANAHTVENRSDAPVRFLVTGTNPERDIVHYPDLGRTRHKGPDGWRLLDATGALLESGPAG